MEYVQGVAKLEGNVILIQNLEKLLSCGEQKELDDATRRPEKRKAEKVESKRRAKK